MALILVADDDAHIRELVTLFLEREGFSVVGVPDGAEALARIRSGGADLAILDVMMPVLDGWRACRLIKEEAPDLPLLMLTARGEISQKLRGFELGADDYLVKPFEPAELVARVKALLRRSGGLAEAPLRAGSLEIDAKGWRLAVGGEPVSLPRREFELLALLASQPGRTFTREGLLSAVWGPDFEGTARTLDVHVNRLRDKLPPERSGIRIETLRGLGYRLVEEARDGGWQA